MIYIDLLKYFKKSRLQTLIIGLILGLIYIFLIQAIIFSVKKEISISYLFILPLVIGAIPSLLYTVEQLREFKTLIIYPLLVTTLFSLLSLISGLEGLICLVILFFPFFIFGFLGTFLFRVFSKNYRKSKNKLYISFLIPLIFISIESYFDIDTEYFNVNNTIVINKSKKDVWNNIVNVKNIKKEEIGNTFNNFIGIPNPLNGELTYSNDKMIRKITWDKGIQFDEVIYECNEYDSFYYNIIVNPNSIPPETLDEHLIVGGRYFDVISGYYKIKELTDKKCLVELNCKYRLTTNFNFYSRIWADFLLNNFNETILNIIKNRAESKI